MSLRFCRRKRTSIFAAVLLLVCLSERHAAAQEIIINPSTTTYDFHPSTATTTSGATWYAWHGYSDSHDRIMARRVDADGDLGDVFTLSQSGATHGPPTIIGESDDAISVVWSRIHNERWQVVLRRYRDGQWTEPMELSEKTNDAIYTTAMALPNNNVLVAWSAMVKGKWRVRCRPIQGSRLQPIRDLSDDSVDAFRPVLVRHDKQLWAFWDQYHQPDYSIHGRIAYPMLSPVEQVSPTGEYCLTPNALSHQTGLHVAWLRKVDVVGGPGVVSQWHSLHVAVRRETGWTPMTRPDGSTSAADLTQGLMAKIEPRMVATGGYLGPRVRPTLLADGDRVWLLWERKSDHRGSTPNIAGDLVGRPGVNGRWQPSVVLKQGRVDYHAIDPPLARKGKVRVLASPLPRRGIRHYESSEITLADAQPYKQDEWTGWAPVSLPVESELTPRRSISTGGKNYKLFWADMHCHNGLTADAEGEPDEMHFYARDRAELDVVVFTNNDFYNVPLTQYDFELGHLFATTFSARRHSAERRLLSLPGFEWTSRIPGVATAKLSDSGSWLPPYRNRSYPNHRSVIYPPNGGPLVHFTEVGNDISRLNEAVENAGGITLSQHNAFKLSGHPVEVGFELTSGWSNYIAARPRLFHEPLNQGARLGFTANGDTHRRAPGLSGALTGIYAEDLTAESILDALRNRRCFATMGSQIFLDTRAGEALMGSESKTRDGSITLTLHAIGTRSINHARLIRNGETIHEVKGDGTHELKVRFIDDQLPKGTHWYYWQVTQSGVGTSLPGNLMPAHGPVAWSSPTWVVAE